MQPRRGSWEYKQKFQDNEPQKPHVDDARCTFTVFAWEAAASENTVLAFEERSALRSLVWCHFCRKMHAVPSDLQGRPGTDKEPDDQTRVCPGKGTAPSWAGTTPGTKGDGQDVTSGPLTEAAWKPKAEEVSCPSPDLCSKAHGGVEGGGLGGRVGSGAATRPRWTTTARDSELRFTHAQQTRFFDTSLQ